MQVVLLSVSAMYFILGSTLEYIKRTDIIIAALTLIFGALKLSVRFSLSYFEIDRLLLFD
jgi:hypothetical protein